MRVDFYPINYLNMKAFIKNFYSKDNFVASYAYSIIIAKNKKGEFVLCRHKDRTTWEIPGGHIEKGETAYDAAKRELFEETGASQFTIRPVFDYAVTSDEEKTNCGVVFFAEISEFETLPESEIAEIDFFDKLPENLTYKAIQPLINGHFEEIFSKKPDYIFHASKKMYDVLMPQQAMGKPEENGAENAVYGYETINQVIPFALDFSSCFTMYVDDVTSEIYVGKGITLNDEGIGYIHKLSAENFERLDEVQWISKKPAKVCEVIKIRSGDYKEKIHFDCDFCDTAFS